MKIVLKPLRGPAVGQTTGFVVDFDYNSRFYISRMRNWKKADKPFELAEYEGAPCLYIRDEFLSYPHAELIYVNGRIGIKEARDVVKNHIYVNVQVPTQTNYVKEAILQIGDTIMLGKTLLRVEGESPEQKIISQVYPKLIYVEPLTEDGNLHLLRTYQGQEVLVEYYKYPNLSKQVRTRLLDFKKQFENVQKQREKDPELEKIIPKLIDIELMEADSNGYLFIVREKIYSPNLEEILIKRKETFSLKEALEFGLLLVQGLIKLQPLVKSIYQNLVPTSIHYDRYAQNPRVIFDKIFDIQFLISKSDPLATGEFNIDRLYWPPEYVEFGKYTVHSQIYGITLLIITALLGEPPIQASDEQELKNALRAEKINIPQNVPRIVRNIFEQGCAVNQHKRFRNLFEFKLALSQTIKQLPTEKNRE